MAPKFPPGRVSRPIRSLHNRTFVRIVRQPTDPARSGPLSRRWERGSRTRRCGPWSAAPKRAEVVGGHFLTTALKSGRFSRPDGYSKVLPVISTVLSERKLIDRKAPNMPVYEYHCPTCGNNFERLQPMSSEGSDCPVCEQPARRAISVFASISGGELAGSSDFGPLPPMGGGGCCGGSCGCGP